MALKELKYNDSKIYVEDNVSKEEMGYALETNKKNNLDETQELKIVKSRKNSLEDTISMEPIEEEYEWFFKPKQT